MPSAAPYEPITVAEMSSKLSATSSIQSPTLFTSGKSIPGWATDERHGLVQP